MFKLLFAKCTTLTNKNNFKVGFINGICIPCYSLLYKLIPETKPLLDQCQANLARWQALHDEQKKKEELAALKS
jgi:hypothetical protein